MSVSSELIFSKSEKIVSIRLSMISCLERFAISPDLTNGMAIIPYVTKPSDISVAIFISPLLRFNFKASLRFLRTLNVKSLSGERSCSSTISLNSFSNSFSSDLRLCPAESKLSIFSYTPTSHVTIAASTVPFTTRWRTDS